MREDLSTPAVLSALRVTLHVSFAALLVLAAVRAVLRRPSDGRFLIFRYPFRDGSFLDQYLAMMKAMIQQGVARMPTHEAFIAANCKAPPIN